MAKLGKRVYRDELSLVDEAHSRRRLYRIYGDASYEVDEQGDRPRSGGGRPDRRHADSL